MQTQTVEEARAAVGGTAAQVQNRQTEGYSNQSGASRANLLQQAATILLILQLPLTAIEEVALWGLLQRHLERAYRGAKP
jgi:hypothetical protein